MQIKQTVIYKLEVDTENKEGRKLLFHSKSDNHHSLLDVQLEETQCNMPHKAKCISRLTKIMCNYYQFNLDRKKSFKEQINTLIKYAAA